MIGKKTWGKIDFQYELPKKMENLIVGLSFPRNNQNVGLEPSILTVLPEGDNVIYCSDNHDYNDDEVQLYLCSVYITGYDEFIDWASRHNQKKIIVGGYHPTAFPEDFIRHAHKIVQGPCDDIWPTIMQQEGQIVDGITSYKKMPRYDLYNPSNNQQIIPEKKPKDLCTSINTSQGCPYACDFCCTPLLSKGLSSKPLGVLKQEIDYMNRKIFYYDKPKYVFIRDENFPLQPDWVKRLRIIKSLGAKIYLFASANLLNERKIKLMKERNVYMVCLGLEDITTDYGKNKNLDEVCRLLKKHGIYIYLSFIVNPLKVIGRKEGYEFYKRLMKRFQDLAPEMVCGNFLMPFRGTKIWDEFYPFVDKEDYKHFDSKTAFLIKNKIVREKMHFFMFWYQWLYYTSDFYKNNVRRFFCDDTLSLRFVELYKQFEISYRNIWNVRP